MIFKAILSSKSRPEYGTATVSFPIPSDQYDHTIELLEAMDIGSAAIQDCWVDEISSSYPILNRLVTQSVNLDELDYLMKLEQIYTGASFPQYQYDDPLLTLGVPIQPEISGPVETAWLYLPMPEKQIGRTLGRIGIINQDAAYFVEDSTLPHRIFEILERPDDAILELNRMCQAIRGLDAAGLEKLEAVVLMAQPEDAGEIRHVAKNLDQFEFVPSVESPERNSQITKLGYVAYHGSLTLDELMRDDPAEQYQRELEMGGMA